MITVISGTNRPGSNTRKIAVLIQEMLQEAGEEVTLLDLAELPPEIFADSSYASKPGSFAAFQDQILETDGVLTVVPEYNGSFPGVLKYFIDMLRFPESLYENARCLCRHFRRSMGWRCGPSSTSRWSSSTVTPTCSDDAASSRTSAVSSTRMADSRIPRSPTG